MPHEGLSRMVDYSHKMIDTIAKEVEDNFITRKQLLLSIVGIRSWQCHCGSTTVCNVVDIDVMV